MNQAPATPPDDDKDWTWVIREPCQECGFDPTTVSTAQLADALRDAAVRWQQVPQLPGADRRPSPRVWSPLEYAAHVVDVYTIMGDRAELMLTESEPTFPNWDQDATALEKRYWEADPVVVAADIAAAADRTAGSVRRRVRRTVAADRVPIERRGVHRPDARDLLPARPGAPPARRQPTVIASSSRAGTPRPSPAGSCSAFRSAVAAPATMVSQLAS